MSTLTPGNAAELLRKWTFGGIEAVPVNEVKAGVKIGIYGPGGSGKTTLVGTACDSEYGGPMLYLNARGNPQVIKSRKSQVVVVEIAKFSEVESVRKDIIKSLQANDFPFKSIAIDNVSDVHAQDLRDRYGPMTEVQWEKHSASTADILSMTRNFSDIADIWGINTFFVLWETPEKREIRGRTVTRSEVALPGALQAQLPGIINWLGRLYIMDDAPRYTRCLDFRPIETQQVSKYQVDPDDSSYEGIDMEIYDPHLGHILDSIKGGLPYPVQLHQKPVNQAKRS